MVTVNVGKDELYPYFTLEEGELDGPLAEFYSVFDMDSEELERFKRIRKEFFEMQRRLQVFYELHRV